MPTFKWPLQPGSLDTPALVDGEDRLSSWIMILLSTSKGERVMRPNYGTNIWNVNFENISPGLLAMIRRDIVTSIRENEPSIELKAINLEVANKSIVITIEYGWNSVVKDFTFTISQGA